MKIKTIPEYRHCRVCKIETPMYKEGINLLGCKFRCAVCGTLWVHDSLIGDQRVLEPKNKIH